MAIHRLTVSAAFFCIAACSTSSPPAPEPVAAVVEPAAEVTKPVPEVTQPAASEDPTAREEGLEVVAVPEVPKVVHNSPPPEMKCRREKELGSRRIKRVCQTVAEAELSQDEAEDALKRLQHMKDIQTPGLDLYGTDCCLLSTSALIRQVDYFASVDSLLLKYRHQIGV